MPVIQYEDVTYQPICGDSSCSSCPMRGPSNNRMPSDAPLYGIWIEGDPEDDENFDADGEYFGDNGLESWNYKPVPVFYGDGGPFYGMEIEVTTDAPRTLVKVVRDHAGGIAYCKDDGSVAGGEIVTHPMSYEWAMSDFPWDMLTEIRKQCDATTISQENGIHVHVGRDGFDNPAHIYRWMKVFYRNPADIQRIARRRSSNWASFSPDHRRAHIHHVKYGKPEYRRLDDDTQGSRYQAINTTNNDTLEVRVFASTLRPNRARVALQVVAGTVEYARQLTADDITHRRGWEWKSFVAWAARDGRYPDLIAENRTRRPL